MQDTLHSLSTRLDYTFQNTAYLKQALTHCSVGPINNERLEFLGDSILNFVIASELFQRFPHESEGWLSRLRAHLVSGETLAQIALDISLGNHLLLGQGELKSGGFRRASILADALEAIFAAVFLDGGYKDTQAVILKLYHSRLEQKLPDNHLKDFKTQLQEYLQSKKLSLPVYQLIKTQGEEHNQVFHITCEVSELELQTYGQSSSRRKAEQQAAKKFLELLGAF